MCGILGILSSDPTACSPEAVQSLSAWRDRLSRRGPDGAGLTSLAGLQILQRGNRLSITPVTTADVGMLCSVFTRPPV